MHIEAGLARVEQLNYFGKESIDGILIALSVKLAATFSETGPELSGLDRRRSVFSALVRASPLSEISLEVAQDSRGVLADDLVLHALMVLLDKAGIADKLALAGASGMPDWTAHALLELAALFVGSSVMCISWLSKHALVLRVLHLADLAHAERAWAVKLGRGLFEWVDHSCEEEQHNDTETELDQLPALFVRLRATLTAGALSSELRIEWYPSRRSIAASEARS